MGKDNFLKIISRLIVKKTSKLHFPEKKEAITCFLPQVLAAIYGCNTENKEEEISRYINLFLEADSPGKIKEVKIMIMEEGKSIIEKQQDERK